MLPLASIPSPSSGVVDLGPLHIHMYGLMLLLAIAACIGLTGWRWTKLGGDWDLVIRVAVWGVAFGIVGARAYHDITSWDEVPDTWWGPFAVWEGGLGVWGGILLGAVAGAVVIRKPTNLPWGLEIDADHRPPQYIGSDTFHPTFLYEFVYDLVLAGLLILVGNRFRVRPPALFSLYVSVYCVGRVFEELLRVDPSHHFLGQRVNFWVAIVVFACSTAFFVWWQFIRPEGTRPSVGRRREAPRGPAMAVPRGRVRPRR